MQRRNWLMAATAMAMTVSFVATTAQAQAWPARPIKLVVPFPPGGLIDNMARLVAPILSKLLGESFVIEN